MEIFSDHILGIWFISISKFEKVIIDICGYKLIYGKNIVILIQKNNHLNYSDRFYLPHWLLEFRSNCIVSCRFTIVHYGQIHLLKLKHFINIV